MWSDSEQNAKSFVRNKFRNGFRMLYGTFQFGEAAQFRKLRTWRYEACWRMHDDDKDFMSAMNRILTGDQFTILTALLTRILHGSSGKQLRPIHVKDAVLFATLAASGHCFDTKLLWDYRSVLAESVRVSVFYIEVIIRMYDRRLHDLVVDYLKELSEEQEFGDIPQNDHNSGPTGQASSHHGNLAHRLKLAMTNICARICCSGEARTDTDGNNPENLNGNRWSPQMQEKARHVTRGSVNRLCNISTAVAALVSQFWDNVASMTIPICKFEHGKNRFIFRTSTGELCTGTSVIPKLALQQIEAGAEAGSAGAQVSGKMHYSKQEPDLQVITSDYAIDCSINVLGSRNMLFTRERRALRTCMMLAHHTSYNLDKTGYTPGICAVSRAPKKDKDLKKGFTCNMPPDLISLLLCNQMGSAVNCNVITVITGLMVRGHHVEFLREHANLRVPYCANSPRSRNGYDYVEIVRKLIEGDQRGRGTREGAEDSKWKRVVCGAVKLLFTARSSSLLTRSSRADASDSYRLHELSDLLAYASHTSIQVL